MNEYDTNFDKIKAKSCNFFNREKKCDFIIFLNKKYFIEWKYFFTLVLTPLKNDHYYVKMYTAQGQKKKLLKDIFPGKLVLICRI